jgi:predicted RNA polymerase sigma factor
VVELNRVFALAMAFRPAVGLSVVDRQLLLDRAAACESVPS